MVTKPAPTFCPQNLAQQHAESTEKAQLTRVPEEKEMGMGWMDDGWVDEGMDEGKEGRKDGMALG